MVSYSLPDLPRRDDRLGIVPSLARKRRNNDEQRRQTRLKGAADYFAPLDAGDAANANAGVSAAGQVNAWAD